jgi:hypothetical protein
MVMANGVPVRLSEALAVRARAASEVLDRSMTEQVEHWARLGQVVEAVIGSATVHQLKSRSFDPDLSQRLAFAATADGRAAAAKLIHERNPAFAASGTDPGLVDVANGKHAANRKSAVATNGTKVQARKRARSR